MVILCYKKKKKATKPPVVSLDNDNWDVIKNIINRHFSWQICVASLWVTVKSGSDITDLPYENSFLGHFWSVDACPVRLHACNKRIGI